MPTAWNGEVFFRPLESLIRGKVQSDKMTTSQILTTIPIIVAETASS